MVTAAQLKKTTAKAKKSLRRRRHGRHSHAGYEERMRNAQPKLVVVLGAYSEGDLAKPREGSIGVTISPVDDDGVVLTFEDGAALRCNGVALHTALHALGYIEFNRGH